MNTDRELRILRATGIEGVVEIYKEYVRLSKITSFSLNFAYALIFILLFSMYLPEPIIFGILVFIGAEIVCTHTWVGLQLSRKIIYVWHVFSQYVETNEYLGLLVFISLVSPTVGLITSSTIGFSMLILILSLIGLLPIIAIPFILKSAKKWPLSVVRTFKGPYTKEEIEKIKESLSLNCGKVEKAKWSNEFKLICHGFRVRIISLSNFKNYQIRVIIEGVDESNASMVRVVVEKIDKMLIK